MTPALKPIRRVVTGNDADGKSRVLWDSAAPNANPGAIRPGTGMTDVWVYQECPAPSSGGETTTATCRSVSSRPSTAGICASCSRRPNRRVTIRRRTRPRCRCTSRASAPAAPGTKAAPTRFSSPVHKSETVDYGIVLEGERVLLLDDGEHVMKPGDVVVQLGNWHGWCNPREGSLMAFVMMGAKYEIEN